jgi:cytochrome c-type biogenesis protein CcmH/NrfG
MELRTRIQEEPENPQYLGKLGRFCLEEDNFVEAEAAFERARDLDPNDPRWYAGLAQATYAQLKWKEAIKSLERLLVLQPTNGNAKRLLERARRKSKSSAKARMPSRVRRLFW